MKHFTIIIGMVAILLMGIVFAAPADITYTVPTPVVSDVPFLIDVNVNAGTIPFTEFDLSFTSNPSGVVFESHSPNYFTVHPLTGTHSNMYRYYTTATGATQISTGQLFQLLAHIQGTTTSQITLAAGSPSTITQSIGYGALAVSSTPSAPFTPVLSVCGDGVVGYIDANNNRIKEGTEANEACDDGNINPNDGCSATCTYVGLGYSCTNTAFGDRNSVCTAMSRKDFFLAKMNALFNNQCYPTDTHPNVIYEWFCDSDTSSNVPSAAAMISAVGDALVTYLTTTSS